MSGIPPLDLTAYAGQDVLVTGAGGFLGGHLCRRLVALGARVTGLVRPGRVLPELPILHARVGVDPLGPLLLRARPRIVFHLAASLGGRDGGTEELRELVATNVRGSIDVMAAALEAGVETMIQTGTLAEYGAGPVPFTEDQSLQPRDAYSASKATASLWGQAMKRWAGLNCIATRMSVLYGPGQPPRLLIPQVLEAFRAGRTLSMTSGEQTRDFLWIEDAVEALLRLGLRPDLGGAAFNVCSGQEVRVRDLVDLLGQLLGSPPPVRFGVLPHRKAELFRYVGSPEALERATGYRPSTPLEEGLAWLLEAEGLLGRS